MKYLSKLEENIEIYVEKQLENYKSIIIRAPKVIHDPILGSNVFYPQEIAILDLPILQRLRRISQVDFVPLVFPSGNHNRFEHTLGVTIIADKIAEAVFKRITEGQKKGKEYYKEVKIEKEYLINHVRMAAILHDCGHGPFSHMSEQIFKNFDDIVNEKNGNERFAGASAHEIFSYLIVTSKALRKFFNSEIKEGYNVEYDLDFIGDMIIGYIEKPENAFAIEIINGAFDADKLDYIQRDSHFTGIKMVLDLFRLFHTIDIIKDEKSNLRLTVDISGESILEEIIFNKMMLFSTVYHHHKVRAAECLCKSLFREIKNNQVKIHGLDFTNSTDFLFLTDDDIYNLSKSNDCGSVSKISQDLYKRNLPKRAFVISLKTINYNDYVALQEIMSYFEKPNADVEFIEVIAYLTKENGEEVPKSEIWIDIPASGPTFKEAIEWPIKSDGDKNDYIKLRNLFPADDWSKAFTENKFKGYVYTRPEHREAVYKATMQAFKEVCNTEFNVFSKILCKMN